MAALWAAQRQKRRRIVYCFNILIDFVLQYTIQRACQNTKDVDYQRCDILALVRECKETLQRSVKEIDRVKHSELPSGSERDFSHLSRVPPTSLEMGGAA